MSFRVYFNENRVPFLSHSAKNHLWLSLQAFCESEEHNHGTGEGEMFYNVPNSPGFRIVGGDRAAAEARCNAWMRDAVLSAVAYDRIAPDMLEETLEALDLEPFENEAQAIAERKAELLG